MGRKIEDERDARACLKAAKAAGVTPRAWSHEHGVDARSLNAWRINLSRYRGIESGGSVALPRLVELVPAAEDPVAGRYVVRVAGAEIELGSDFDEETVVRLVRALRAC